MINPLATPFAYRVLTSLLGPFVTFWLKRRVRQGKEDPDRLQERLGRTHHVRPPGELVWLHGASVGETQMLRPLIDRLLEKPDRHVLVTSGTRTSAHLLDSQLPARAIHQYAPLDTPKATARFIACWSPNLAVFAESELWPNLIWTADRAGIPLALINARMSERSLSGWAKRLPLAGSVFGAFDLILAADRRTGDGIAQLALRDIADVGSLKFDAPALDAVDGAVMQLRQAIGNRPVWLAASTHEAEEAVFHRLHAALPDIFMIWLPRHPARGAALAETLCAPRRAAGDVPGADDSAYVMDTMGEMGLALSVSDVCVIGGSFDASLMGHNPLEAARAGVPVISGPFHASFVDLYRRMQEANAVMISNEGKAAALIRDGVSGKLDDMAAQATAFAASQSGALDRTHQALEAML